MQMLARLARSTRSHAYPRSGPWKPPLECTDDTKAPYDTDYEDSDAPVTPERPADTPLPSSNGPAVSDIYGPLIRSVIQLRAHVDALPPDARAKVVATVTKFHEETGTVADLMALLPSPSSGSGKDKHEESPSDTNTRNKNAGASSSNALENRAGNEAKVADDGSEEDSDGDVDIEESDAEANHLESDDDGEVAAPEANDEPWYLAAMIWERPAKGVDIFCFDPDLSVAWYLETVLWVDSFSQPKIHFLSIPYTEDDVVLELRSNLGLVLRHFDVTSVEVWKPDIYTWVEQSVTTPIHVHGQDDKLLLLRLPDVGYCQGFLKFFERMECDQTGSDVMANALQRDGGFSWQEKGKGVDRGDNR